MSAAKTTATKTATAAPPAPRPDTAPKTKLDTVSQLIRRTEGATLDELITATGWQPHSVRAAISGLRKQGLEVLHIKEGAQSRYVVTEQP